MKKSIALLVLASLATLARSESTKMLVTSEGVDLGSAVVSRQVLSDGSVQVSITMDLTQSGGRSIRVRQESVCDAMGKPVRKIQEIMIPDGSKKQRTVVIFSSKGAEVTADGSDKADLFAVPDAEKTAAASDVWFSVLAPKVGETAKYYAFDPSAKKWDLTETTYVGPKPYKWARKNVSAHELRMKRNGKVITSLVDEKGLPFLIETEGLKMERIAQEGK